MTLTSIGRKLYQSRLMVPSLVLFAFAIRLVMYWAEPGISRDGVLYIESAKIWFFSNDFSRLSEYWITELATPNGFWIPPLFPYLLLLLQRLWIPLEAGAIGINILFGSLSCYLFYRIAFLLTGRRLVALGVLFLAAVHPQLIALSIAIQRDALYILIAGTCIAVLIADWKMYKVWHWICLGGLVALGVLCRYEMLEFFVYFGIYYIVNMVSHRLRFLPCFKAACSLCFSYIIMMILMCWIILGSWLDFINYYGFALNKIGINIDRITQSEIMTNTKVLE